MNLRVKSHLLPAITQRFTREDLALLAEAFDVVPLADNQSIVTISMTPPPDTRYPWQKTDAEGRYIGPLKRYSASGQWV